MNGLTLHDFARDVAAVIEHAGGGPAVVVGHAFGNWIARMTAADHPLLVRGVAILAAAAKTYPQSLAEAVTRITDLALPDAERLKYLSATFFAPGHDASVWLAGWYPEVNASQRAAGLATRQDEWWVAGSAPLLDLQSELDTFKTRESKYELKDVIVSRYPVTVIPAA